MTNIEIEELKLEKGVNRKLLYILFFLESKQKNYPQRKKRHACCYQDVAVTHLFCIDDWKFTFINIQIKSRVSYHHRLEFGKLKNSNFLFTEILQKIEGYLGFLFFIFWMEDILFINICGIQSQRRGNCKWIKEKREYVHLQRKTLKRWKNMFIWRWRKWK